jgi:hypothetical protein
MSTDFRALCAELADALNGHTSLYEGHESELVARARTTLAQPEPVVPTDKELLEAASNALGYVHIRVDSKELEANGEELIAYARAILTRYARPTIEPVPVAERLPEPEDCCGNPRNGQGQWCWGRVRPQTDAGTPVVWRLMLVECLIDEATHWLPHHALPVPGAEVG